MVTERAHLNCLKSKIIVLMLKKKGGGEGGIRGL